LLHINKQLATNFMYYFVNFMIKFKITFIKSYQF